MSGATDTEHLETEVTMANSTPPSLRPWSSPAWVCPLPSVELFALLAPACPPGSLWRNLARSLPAKREADIPPAAPRALSLSCHNSAKNCYAWQLRTPDLRRHSLHTQSCLRESWGYCKGCNPILHEPTNCQGRHLSKSLSQSWGC